MEINLNINHVIKRYENAKEERNLKLEKFADAYRLSYPTHAKLLIDGKQSVSFDKTNFRWDTTAIQGLKNFASNIQSIIMPPFQQWAKFKADASIDETKSSLLNQALESPSSMVFQTLNVSNLMLQVSIALQDMGISVGLLQICTTEDSNRPIQFKAIPMHKVALGEYDGRIEDVYREMNVKARDIQSMWPDAQLSGRLQTLATMSPEEEVILIEGTIYYPMNDISERYIYFVMDKDNREFIVKRRQSISRWIPFRFAVSPGEVWGDGPILQILDAIRVVNKIVELDLTNAGMKVSRPLFVNGKKVMNPHNMQLKPGAFIHVNDTRPGELPIVPLDIAGDFNFDQVTLQEYKDEIRDALMGDPLGPNQTPNQSATETSIRQQNWIKRSAASMGRMANELLYPIIFKTTYLLSQLPNSGLDQNLKADPATGNITYDGQKVAIDLLSPLATLHDQQKANEFFQYNQMLQGIFGPELAPMMLNIPRVASEMADKMDVDPNLIKTPDDLINLANKFQQSAQNNQAQQQQAAMQQQNQENPSNPQIPPLNIG